MAKMPTGQFLKLPKWAQVYIREIEREREVAVRELRYTVDNQTPSGFCYKDMVCIGESGDNSVSFLDRYVQTNKMTITHRGVTLEVTCPEGEDMRLQWGDLNRTTNHTAFVPNSYQSAHLVAKENMR